MGQSKILFGDSQRIFLNPSIGCESSCSYCYLRQIGIPTGEKPKEIISAESIVKTFNGLNSFKVGRDGTIISIGCYCDPWSDINRSHTIELLDYFIAYGNPIQISTKQYVANKDLRFFQSRIQWFGQLSIYISCSSITYWSEFEKGTVPPDLRFESLRILNDLGIPMLVYIKPVIENVTIHDISKYMEIIATYGVNTVIGSFFSTKKSDRSAPIHKNLLFYDANVDELEIKRVLGKACQVKTHSTEFVEVWRKR